MSTDIVPVSHGRVVVADGSTAVSLFQQQQTAAAARETGEPQRRADPMFQVKKTHAEWIATKTDKQGFVDTRDFQHNLVLTSGYTLPPGRVHAGEAFQLLEGARLAKLTQEQVNIILQHVAKYA